MCLVAALNANYDIVREAFKVNRYMAVPIPWRCDGSMLFTMEIESEKNCWPKSWPMIKLPAEAQKLY